MGGLAFPSQHSSLLAIALLDVKVQGDVSVLGHNQRVQVVVRVSDGVVRHNTVLIHNNSKYIS